MAVYTPVTPAEAGALLERFGVGPLVRLEPIAEGIENSNFRVEAGGARYVLTVYERGDARRVAEVLALVAALAAAGVPCPPPLPLQGQETYLAEHRGKPVSLTPFADGVFVEAPDEAQLEALGRAVAALHRAGADLPFAPPGPHRLEMLLPRAEAAAQQVAAENPALARLLREEAGVQARAEPVGLPEGVIHADLFRDNVLFRPHRPEVRALLDFHLAGRGPWLYDLAVILLDACWCDDAVCGDRARALLRGYRTGRPLEGGEYTALPLLLRRAALRFLCLRLERFGLRGSHPGAGVWKNPAELEQKLRRLGGGQPVG